MARPKSRSSSFGNKKKSTGKPSYEKKEGASSKRTSSYRDEDKSQERKPFAKGKFVRKDNESFEKKSFDKKDKKDWPDKKPFTKSKFAKKSEDGFEKKSFDKRDKKEWSDKSSFDKKPFTKDKFKRKSDDGFDKKPFAKRDKKEWTDQSFEKGDKKKWSEKSTGDRKPKSLSKWDASEAGAKKKFSKDNDRNPKWKSKNEFESDKKFKPNSYTEKSKFKRDQFGSTVFKKNKEDENDEAFSLDDHRNKKKSFERGKNEYNRLIKKSEKNIGKKEKSADDGMIRLNRYIANSGVCSRRDADKLIESGAVMVNGRVVTQLGTKIGPHDKVQYGGQTIKTEKMVYILLNKPKDYITTMDDPQGRKTVMGLIRGACKERVYPVGRLDRNTTGVLLFTNDGELTRRLTHPKFLVSKMYHVEVDQNFDRDDLVKMRNGLELEDGFIKPDQLEYTGEGKSELGIEIHSGRNRIVRRMFEHLGYEVIKLDRVMFAGLSKKDTPRGKWRFLNEKEVGFLKML